MSRLDLSKGVERVVKGRAFLVMKRTTLSECGQLQAAEHRLKGDRNAYEEEPAGVAGERLLLGAGLRYDPSSRKRRVAGNLNSIPPITGAQIRAARALLKWSVRKLSDQCGVSKSAIARGEQVNGTPSMQARTLNTIRQVLKSTELSFSGSMA